MPADLTQAFEDRADPVNKPAFAKFIVSADAARLASLQFQFTPGKFTSMLANTIVPLDSVIDHWRLATTDNAYAGSASWGSAAGWIAGFQTALEFLRNIVRLAGDVVGAASALLGVIALGAGALALIPPLAPVMGTLALAAAAAGEILAILKAGADFVDALIGLIQNLFNALRARLTDDPIQRAQIAQQIHKESSDTVQSAVSGAVGAATIGIGRKIGGVLPKAVSDEAAAAGRMTVKELIASTAVEEAAVERIAAGAKPFTEVVNKGSKFLPKYRFVYHVAENFGPPDVAKLGNIGKFSAAAVETRVMSVNIASGGAGTVLGLSPTGLKVAAGKSSSGPGTPGAAGGSAAGELTDRYVSYWPSALENMGSTREWVHNAQVRMVSQFDLAKDDLGDKRAATLAITGGVTTIGNRITMTGGLLSAQADLSKTKSDEVMGAVGPARDKKSQIDQQKATMTAKTAQVDQLTKDAQDKANAAKADESWVGKVFDVFGQGKNWVLGKVAGLQSTLISGLNSVFMKMAGLDDQDKQLAGIATDETNKKAADDQTKGVGGDLGGTGDVVSAKVAALKAGADNQEQNAIQGAVDAANWIEALDGYDQELAQQQDTGKGYIERNSPIVAADLKARQSNIDAASVGKLTAATAVLSDRAATAPGAVKDLGDQAVADMPSRIAPTLPAASIAPAQQRGHQLTAQIVAKYQESWSSAAAAAKSIAAKAPALVGTSDWSTYDDLGAAIESTYKGLDNSTNQALADIDATLQKIVNAVAAGGSGSGSTPGAPPAPGSPPAPGGQPAPSPSAPPDGGGSQQPTPAPPPNQ